MKTGKNAGRTAENASTMPVGHLISNLKEGMEIRITDLNQNAKAFSSQFDCTGPISMHLLVAHCSDTQILLECVNPYGCKRHVICKPDMQVELNQHLAAEFSLRTLCPGKTNHELTIWHSKTANVSFAVHGKI